MNDITGKDLIALGYKSGPIFKDLLSIANDLKYKGYPLRKIVPELDAYVQGVEAEAQRIIDSQLAAQNPNDVKLDVYLDAYTDFEVSNKEATIECMREVMKTPTIISAQLMPDACPVGDPGNIPVGGVTEAYNAIHPGMHSSDVCCSMFLTEFDADVSVSSILDAVQEKSHFGYGGNRDGIKLGHGSHITKRAENNKFLANVQMFQAMDHHLGTQGDGNHFFFVGRSERSGNLTLVTHHGSRKPGALLYKEGMRVAELFRKELSPETLPCNAWIPYDTWEGEEYWEALNILREWTKHNHSSIHREVLLQLGVYDTIVDQYWNEHNFVFKDGTSFWHAKGSTPMFDEHTHDIDNHGRRIIPLNMGEPILIVKKNPESPSKFAPHGAGRNMSRGAYRKMNEGKSVEQLMDEQVSHIDARFYCGIPDSTELPGAYKNAKEIIDQINKYKLAIIHDKILPLGCMMAGDQPKPWSK